MAALNSSSAEREAPAAPEPEQTPLTKAAVPPSTVHEVQAAASRRHPFAAGRSDSDSGSREDRREGPRDRGRGCRAWRGWELHRYLAEQAEAAARQWRFTPAKNQPGARVASSKTLHFVFEP